MHAEHSTVSTDGYVSVLVDKDENTPVKKPHEENAAAQKPRNEKETVQKPNDENEAVVTEGNAASNATNNNCTIICINAATVSRSGAHVSPQAKGSPISAFVIMCD